MMGRSPRCYIPSFMEIGQLVPEKIFEGFLPYMGMVAILVMYLKAYIQNLIKNGPVVSEKNMF